MNACINFIVYAGIFNFTENCFLVKLKNAPRGCVLRRIAGK